MRLTGLTKKGKKTKNKKTTTFLRKKKPKDSGKMKKMEKQ